MISTDPAEVMPVASARHESAVPRNTVDTEGDAASSHNTHLVADKQAIHEALKKQRWAPHQGFKTHPAVSLVTHNCTEGGVEWDEEEGLPDEQKPPQDYSDDE